MSTLGRSALLQYFPNDQWMMSWNHVWVKRIFQSEQKTNDFNATEYYKILGIVSGQKLQVNFKTPPIVEFLCCIKEEVSTHLKNLLKNSSFLQLQMVSNPLFNLTIFQLYNGGKAIHIQ